MDSTNTANEVFYATHVKRKKYIRAYQNGKFKRQTVQISWMDENHLTVKVISRTKIKMLNYQELSRMQTY